MSILRVAVASSSYTRNDRTVPLTQVAVAGSEHNYQIITADKYSNQLTYDPYGTPTNLTFAPNKYGPGLLIAAGLLLSMATHKKLVHLNQETGECTESAETTGTYALKAYISDGLVLDGPGGSQLPLNMEVIASDADYSKFTLTGAGITASATVNSKATLTLEAGDVYGNFKKDRSNLVNDIIDGISQTIYSDDALLMEESTIQEHSVTFDSATGNTPSNTPHLLLVTWKRPSIFAAWILPIRHSSRRLLLVLLRSYTALLDLVLLEALSASKLTLP